MVLVVFTTFKVFGMPVQLTLGQLSTYDQTLQGRGNFDERVAYSWLSSACGRTGKLFHPLGVQCFNISSPKMTPLANFTARIALSSVQRTTAIHQVSFSIVFCQSQGKPVLETSGSLLQLVMAVHIS